MFIKDFVKSPSHSKAFRDAAIWYHSFQQINGKILQNTPRRMEKLNFYYNVNFYYFFRGSTEPVHCLSTYYSELISGTTNNRIGVHTAIDQDASFSSTKLRSDTFKGVLTAMTVLPLNRMLLLGGESGNISLLC